MNGWMVDVREICRTVRLPPVRPGIPNGGKLFGQVQRTRRADRLVNHLNEMH